MKPIMAKGCNVVLASPEDWIGRDHGHDNLPVTYQDGKYFSLWQPSTEELLAMFAGAPVLLQLDGDSHPPAWVSIGEKPSLAEQRKAHVHGRG
ncbi:MAG TPA: hypothetical protein VKT73_12975 [Xanthobacteraceae bacterium]|nr:hypothetical protein [Xanthobacteraceae bacterium]